MKASQRILLTCLTALVLAMPGTLLAQKTNLGVFTGHGDVGEVLKPGSASYNPQKRQYEMAGAGYNVWFDHDEFQYLSLIHI